MLYGDVIMGAAEAGEENFLGRIGGSAGSAARCPGDSGRVPGGSAAVQEKRIGLYRYV